MDGTGIQGNGGRQGEHGECKLIGGLRPNCGGEGGSNTDAEHLSDPVPWKYLSTWAFGPVQVQQIL